MAHSGTRQSDDALLERQRAVEGTHLERAGVTGMLAAGLVLISLAALALPAHRPLSLVALLTGIAAYAIASRVEVEFPGFAVLPTEAVFVVMWFTLPVRALPLIVCGAMIIGRLPDVLARRMPLDRVLVTVATSWYAVGPALVLYCFGTTGPRWQDAPIYALALLAQFAFDFAPNFILARAVLGRRALDYLRDALPAYGVDTLLAPLGLLAAFTASRYPASVLLLLPVLLLVWRAAEERKDKNTKVIELLRAYKGTALLLGDVIEADDAYTGAHSRDVVSLVTAVSQRLGIDERELDVAEFTALVHDVGKVKIPAEIINKPGPLDAGERELMKTHTLLGEQMLEPIGGMLGEVGRLVRSCHERWDGTGYPDGLAGAEIPLIARIVCVCDAWSAMTTDRPYRPALSRDEAAAELRRNAGTHFDPRVVEALAAELGIDLTER